MADRLRSVRMAGRFASCQSGATMVMVALIFMLLLAAVGIVVDASRLYAVHSKAQNASDSALLGAVATLSTTDLNEEVNRLFNANYPAGYMGSEVGDIAVTEVASGVYEINFNVTVPTVIMQLFGETATTLGIGSQVTRGFKEEKAKSLELALVLDNTGSMGNAGKITALKLAANDLIDIVFDDQETSDRIRISVVPYDIAVNIGTGRETWFQEGGMFGSSRTKYLNGVTRFNRGTISNRQWDRFCGPRADYGCTGGHTCPNPDPCTPAVRVCTTERVCHTSTDPETGATTTGCGNQRRCNCNPCTPSPQVCRQPPGPPLGWSWLNVCPGGGGVGTGYSDISDAPPTSEETRFRVYWENHNYPNNDAFSYMRVNLAPLLFASNAKAEIRERLNAMRIAGETRINIGLMWGWFTLSPRWQGMWDPGKPNLPAPYSNQIEKAIVLMTDGKNIYANGNARINDDTKTAALCAAIKGQGITVYAVGFGEGADIDEDVLRPCASNPVYYFNAPTEEELRTVFKKIADDILFNTLRLSK